VRAVSNAVGRRDRDGWDLPGAFDSLSRGFAALSAAPLVRGPAQRVGLP